jgi:hypothetical protein
MRALWLAALLGSLAVDSAADEVSFAADIVPLFKSRCVVCHLPGSEQGGLSLHPKGGYANLVDVKSTQSRLLRVSPGKPGDSYLYRKLSGTQAQVGGTGERMPFGDASLSAEEIERVRRWIESGAKP